MGGTPNKNAAKPVVEHDVKPDAKPDVKPDEKCHADSITPAYLKPKEKRHVHTNTPYRFDLTVQTVHGTCDWIERYGLSDSDRLNGTTILKAISIGKELPKATFCRLMKCLRLKGATDDSGVCNSILLAAVKCNYYINPGGYKGGFDMIRPGDDNAFNRMFASEKYMVTGPERANHILSVIQHRASDRYLNTPTVESEGCLMTPLKSAVVHNRIHVVTTMLCRFPGVNFDLIHPELPLAEPLRLSVMGDTWQKIDMQNILSLCEHMVISYHSNLNLWIRMVLDNALIPELVSIVASYLARRSLSTVPLILSRK